MLLPSTSTFCSRFPALFSCSSSDNSIFISLLTYNLLFLLTAGSTVQASVQSQTSSIRPSRRLFTSKSCSSSPQDRHISSSSTATSISRVFWPNTRRCSSFAQRLKSDQRSSSLSTVSRRWRSDGPLSNQKDSGKSSSKPDHGYFATDDPQTREEIVSDAKSFQQMFAEEKAKFSESPYSHLAHDENSVFGQYRRKLSSSSDPLDIEGMTPSESGISNSESLRSSGDLKIRRNTVLRKTFWYSFSELAFDLRMWRYALRERKFLVLYALLTAGLIGYAVLRPSPEYDFLGKKRFDEEQLKEQRRLKEDQEEQDKRSGEVSISASIANGASSLISDTWDAVYDFGANFSLLEPFKKLAYVIGGTIVGFRMLHQMWKGDPLSEDERLIVAHTPLSLVQDLRADEYHHVSPLLRIMATGHIPVTPWTALIPPSPWAPHLTIVVDTDLLYSIGFNQSGEKVMRKRPFADYFLASLGENAEIILSSAHHSKASAKHFFRLFDPYGIASHTFTAEDHRWDGISWLKPLEERFIGRKPQRLVVLDNSYDHCGSMCKNVLRIKPWNGNPNDTTFLELTPIMKCAFSVAEEESSLCLISSIFSLLSLRISLTSLTSHISHLSSVSTLLTDYLPVFSFYLLPCVPHSPLSFVPTDMAAGVEEGIDTRTVIQKYEGSSTAKDVIREQLSVTGLDVPTDDPLERRLREKYSREQMEPIVLTDAEFASSLERLGDDRPVGPVRAQH